MVDYKELFGILPLRVIWKVAQELFLSGNHIFGSNSSKQMKNRNQVSPHLEAFILHCDGYANDREPGVWFLDEIYENNRERIEKAYKNCLTTLKQLNKETLDKNSEFILIDRTYELNYRILSRYLNRQAKKEILEFLQRINFYVQGIISRDVKNLERHYQRNKGL